jgi:hypothetical protein
MKWMKERDLLIAQTMAFVQSVTGKAPVAAKTIEAPREVAAPAAPRSVETFDVETFDVETFGVETVEVELFNVETLNIETVEPARPAASALPGIALPLVQMPPVPTPPAVPPAAVEVQRRTVQTPTIEVSAQAPRPMPSPIPFARLDLRGDFQSEIRARVASFRAHQERFNREREAYCTATMAKVHATLKEGERPSPRTEK